MFAKFKTGELDEALGDNEMNRFNTDFNFKKELDIKLKKSNTGTAMATATVCPN